MLELFICVQTLCLNMRTRYNAALPCTSNHWLGYSLAAFTMSLISHSLYNINCPVLILRMNSITTLCNLMAQEYFNQGCSVLINLRDSQQRCVHAESRNCG